jgi:hypothetical protein
MSEFKKGDRVRVVVEAEVMYDQDARRDEMTVNLPDVGATYVKAKWCERVVPPMPEMPPGTTLRWDRGDEPLTLVRIAGGWIDVTGPFARVLDHEDVPSEWAAGRIDPDSVQVPK